MKIWTLYDNNGFPVEKIKSNKANAVYYFIEKYPFMNKTLIAHNDTSIEMSGVLWNF